MLKSGDQTMHRQPSRSTANMDAIDCNVNTNDLALEAEVLKHEDEYRSKSRRDQPSKRSNDNSTHRFNRHSPPSVTRKHHQSPPSRPHHQQHHHYPSQRPHRAPSRSLSPPSPPLTQSSSRHHRPTRPIVSSKRPYPQSESPHGRHHPPTHRSRQELPSERTATNTMSTLEEPRPTFKQETADLSLISEDESTKTRDIRSNSTKTNDSSSILINNNQLHSTPSVPKSNESLLEMNTIPQEPELSIFAKSAFSTMNTSSIVAPTRNPRTDLMQTMDLITSYKTMDAVPSNDPTIQACSKQILIIIQKQIELEKLEIDHREREIKLRQRELDEREKRFKIKSSETNSTINTVNSEPFIITKPNIIEESTPVKSETPINQDLINVSSDESVLKPISPTVDTSKVKSTTKTSDQTTAARKTRFSQLVVDPSLFPSQQKPVLELYSDDLNVPDQSISPTIGTDLKITSSSTCRKVEIQSGNIDKSGSKEPTGGDLRLTLGKRTKQHNNDQHGANGEPTIDDLEPTLNNNNDNKQQSHDYQQQRSVTSASIDTIIDDTNEKRDVRRHRQQPYPSSGNNQRSYTHGSTAKYGSNQKRYENEGDLRTRIFDQKNPKSSRTTHKNNY